jgi:hypothetical protein
MENLESRLAENMRRFNTKNLTEQSNSAVRFAEDIMPTLQPGYNKKEAFGTPINARTGVFNEWRNVHLLVPTAKNLAIASGDMSAPVAPNTPLNYAPTFAIITTLTDAKSVVPLGPLTMELLIKVVMIHMDGPAVTAGLGTFIRSAKVPMPTQPLTVKTMETIAQRAGVVDKYVRMRNELHAALGIKA